MVEHLRNREAAKGKNQHGLPSWLAVFAHQRGRGGPAGLLDAHYRAKLLFSDSEKYFKSARYSNPIFLDYQRLLNLEANVATY